MIDKIMDMLDCEDTCESAQGQSHNCDGILQFGENSPECDSLPFLLKTEEWVDNCVQFTVALPRMETVEGSRFRRVLPNENDVYTITFEGYVLFLTRNESYSQDDAEHNRWKGKYFKVFERSRLLDLVPELTICQKHEDGFWFPGPWKHYGMICQNHIVDVITVDEPIIRKTLWESEELE